MQFKKILLWFLLYFNPIKKPSLEGAANYYSEDYGKWFVVHEQGGERQIKFFDNSKAAIMYVFHNLFTQQPPLRGVRL